jgi:hypothetical protein
MKKMNNYEAPKAEMIELNMSKNIMQTISGGPSFGFSDTGSSF